MNGETRLHMIFLLILILTTILVFLLFSDGTTTEAFGNEISNIPDAEYGTSGDKGQSANPQVPIDPGAGFYAINVGTINSPIWKRKAVPYGYNRDPTDLTKLIGRTDSAILSSVGGLTDADALAPPYLNIPGAEYQGGSPDYGVDKIPPASGFYKVQVIDKGTTKYYMKPVPNDYVADRKDLLENNKNPGTIAGSKKYTKLVYRVSEITETEMMSITDAAEKTDAEIQLETAWDGYYIINNDGKYYRKLIPNGYDIDSKNPIETEYKKLPDPGKHTPLKYNPNFTPDDLTRDAKFTYDAKNTDRNYRDISYGKTDDLNLGKYWMFDDEGKLIEVNTESNKSPILYYVPGAYKFGASNYVPNYEDSVYLSRTTRESQLAPVINTASQLGGFCTQFAGNTTKIEEKCAAQDLNACASTNCCVLLGGQKCVAGSENGPKNVANYTDYNLMNRDFYYYQGKCYGNCP